MVRHRTGGERYDEEADGMQLVADELEDQYRRHQESKAANARIDADARKKNREYRDAKRKAPAHQRLKNQAKRLKGKEHL